MENDFHYSVSLAEFAIKNNIRLINVSSAATYEDGSAGFSDRVETLKSFKPLNMYGYSKNLFDLWHKEMEYINMPEQLRDRQQYFIRADLGKLSATGCSVAFRKPIFSSSISGLKGLNQP